VEIDAHRGRERRREEIIINLVLVTGKERFWGPFFSSGELRNGKEPVMNVTKFGVMNSRQGRNFGAP